MPIGAAMMGFVNVNVGTYANRGFESGTFNWDFINNQVSLNGGSTILSYPTPAGPASSGTYTNNRSVEKVLQSDFGASLPSGEAHCIKLNCAASYTGSNGVSFGPVAHTTSKVSLVEGDIVSYSWKCHAVNGKGYRAFSYLLNGNTGSAVVLQNVSGNTTTEWAEYSRTMLSGEAGEYYFVFIGGFYDTNTGASAPAIFNTIILLDNLVVK